jgi:hypothetical protein
VETGATVFSATACINRCAGVLCGPRSIRPSRVDIQTYRTTDFEGNVALLGSKLVTVDNRTATKPFGAIDTPAPDATVSGSYNVVGWVLTPLPRHR